MAKSQEPVDNFQQLYNDIKKYVELQTDYVKIEFVEKLTILLSTLLLVTLIILLVIFVLFYLFFSLAYSLETVVGGLAVSFCIISVIYLILIGLLLAFRKQIIVNPLVRFLSKLFLNKTNQ
jgi:hypothetical protein